MSYKINLTDGTLLVDLVDGRIDDETTDLVLVGRNYTGYGEFFNENFVRLLENFKNVAPPSTPLTGQLWYDTSDGRLKVFTGLVWKSTDTTVVAAAQPDMLAGDIWIDSANNQIYFSDGSDIILAGPIYTIDQGETGWNVVTLRDIFGVAKTVSRLMIGGTSVAIFSKESFTAANIAENVQFLNGYGFSIRAGININSNNSDFAFYGSAQSTRTLLDSSNNPFAPDDFLKIAANNTTTGSLHVKNDIGLVVGDDSDFAIKVLGTEVALRNQLSGANMRIQVTSGGATVEAITIDTQNTRIGFWQTNPQYDLDLNGDVRISGNLTVEGDTTSLDVSTLRVEDKLVELAVTSDSTLLTDSEVDGAGIVVRVSGDDKSITWNNTYNSWDHSCNVNIPTGFAYKINNADILTSTTLSATVSSAVGLTQIGTLVSLDVDNININGNAITVSGALTVNVTGTVSFNNAGGPVTINGVATPSVSDDPDTVATKEYVDERFLDQDEFLSLDITGLSNSQIALVLRDLIPPATKNTGVRCTVHGTSYSGTYGYDASDGLTKSFVAVDKNGTENQSVIQDFSFSAQTLQPVTLTVTRSLKRFIINGAGQWVHETDLVSSV
jgi:hypothetical protein